MEDYESSVACGMLGACRIVRLALHGKVAHDAACYIPRFQGLVLVVARILREVSAHRRGRSVRDGGCS